MQGWPSTELPSGVPAAGSPTKAGMARPRQHNVLLRLFQALNLWASLSAPLLLPPASPHSLLRPQGTGIARTQEPQFRKLTSLKPAAKRKPCTFPFKGVQRTYQRCRVLDQGRQFTLAWTMNRKTGVCQVWLQGVPQWPYGWVSWGVSPSGKMLNSDAIVGYGNKKNTAQTRIRSYFMPGVKANQLMVDMTVGFIQPIKKTMAIEVLNTGKTMRLFAHVRGLNTPGQKKVIWRGGLGVTDFYKGLLLPHTNVSKAVQYIDFNK